MIKTLFVNGCSWTEGHLLEEEPEVVEYAKSIGIELLPLYRNAVRNGVPVAFPIFELYNKFNWAGSVAEELNIPEIVNCSLGGGSNARIVRTTMDYVRTLTEEQKKETLVVIGWSLTDRNELYLDDKQGHAMWHVFNASHEFNSMAEPNFFENSFKESIQSYWEKYVVDVHSTYACMYNFFRDSELLANFLENQGIKYYFFNSFPVFWGFDSVDPLKLEELKKLADRYNKYSVLSIADSFTEFVERNTGLKLSDGHPNSKAYKLWGQYIVDDMQDRGIV